jgi:hypothetical protein
VDRVEGEQDGDVQPRLLDRDVLKMIDFFRIGEAEHAADALSCVRVRHLAVGQELHLFELLGHRHPVQQSGDPAFHRVSGVGRPARRGGAGGDRQARPEDHRAQHGEAPTPKKIWMTLHCNSRESPDIWDKPCHLSYAQSARCQPLGRQPGRQAIRPVVVSAEAYPARFGVT